MPEGSRRVIDGLPHGSLPLALHGSRNRGREHACGELGRQAGAVRNARAEEHEGEGPSGTPLCGHRVRHGPFDLQRLELLLVAHGSSAQAPLAQRVKGRWAGDGSV